jgi:hypothetical protein
MSSEEPESACPLVWAALAGGADACAGDAGPARSDIPPEGSNAQEATPCVGWRASVGRWAGRGGAGGMGDAVGVGETGGGRGMRRGGSAVDAPRLIAADPASRRT